MIARVTIFALLATVFVVDADAQFRKHRRRGAIIGGVAGAAIGAAIGDKGNNETTGALIGGAVGAVAGGTIGDRKDRRIENGMQYQQGYYYGNQGYGPNYGPQYGPAYPPAYGPHYEAYPAYPEPVPAIDAPQPVTIAEVLEMQRRGLSDATIIHQIQLSGVARTLTVSDVIRLHELGISEPVISAMQGVATEPQVMMESSPVPQYGPSILAPRNGN